MPATFSSLKRQLVVPLMLAATIAAFAVALGSYWLAAKQAETELKNRFAALDRVVQRGQFPLTSNVLQMLADLTSANWYTLGANGEVIDSAANNSNGVVFSPSILSDLQSVATGSTISLTNAGTSYQAMRLSKMNPRGDSATPVRDVVVMFDDSLRLKTLYRAVWLPLWTGLSTIVLLTSIAYWLASRMIDRITKLRSDVQGIAQGDFQREIPVEPSDELGQLSQSISSMAQQLSQMWQALLQRHGQQLLHQISGGMAHNLRNTLTGARMAVELVQRQSSKETHLTHEMSSGLNVAISQLEQAEDYVQRLLLVSRGKEAGDQAAMIRQCLEGLSSGLTSTATHRGVQLDWSYDDHLSTQQVADGATLVSAVSNLVWNAIDAGNNVHVAVKLVESEFKQPMRCRIDVVDDGSGPPESVSTSLFEPFVSSKPEGMGLGLALVRRAAETLAGTVEWKRESDRTVFQFEFPIVNQSPA